MLCKILNDIIIYMYLKFNFLKFLVKFGRIYKGRHKNSETRWNSRGNIIQTNQKLIFDVHSITVGLITVSN